MTKTVPEPSVGCRPSGWTWVGEKCGLGMAGAFDQQRDPGVHAALAFARENHGGALGLGMLGGGAAMAAGGRAAPGKIGPMGAMLAGGGAAVAALLGEAVREGAQEGRAKGQQMNLTDFKRSIQDAIFGQDEKNDWKKLLELQDKQVKAEEEMAKGIAVIAKKRFSIFGD